MEHSTLTAAAIATTLALLLAAPATGRAHAELVGTGDVVCCLDLGLSVTTSVVDGQFRGALEFSGRELASVMLGPRDVVRWGVPILTVVIELGNARTDRLATGHGNVTAR